MSITRPLRGEPIPRYDLAYVHARFRGELHQMLLSNLTDDVDRNSGASFQAKCRQIAKMTGRRPAQIRAYLGNPGNITSIKVVAEILWALDGAVLDAKAERPRLRGEPHSSPVTHL